ncbi:MAG: hypothetical protein ABI333_11020 [bacterium]
MKHKGAKTTGQPSWEAVFQKLLEPVGRELPLDSLTRHLYYAVRALQPPAVGAMHVTCADESEIECYESFQKSFVQYLLPRLKFSHQAAFRIANLGGRYEWGAIPIADAHYDSVAPDAPYKLMVVKLNAHTSVEDTAQGPRYGKLLRYRAESDYCGALHGLLADSPVPALRDLELQFRSEQRDRLAPLRDRKRIPAHQRMLFVALVSARLQARQVVLDIQDHPPVKPTLYIVLPCVTINRSQRDTEILCGVYVMDRALHVGQDLYSGLGDDPEGYRVHHRGPELVTIDDDNVGRVRPVRDHRELIREQLPEPARRLPTDDQYNAVLAEVQAGRYRADHPYARVLVKNLMRLLLDLNPVTGVLLAFTEGVAELRHVHRVEQLVSGAAGEGRARQLMREISQRVDGLPPRRAVALLDALARRRR